MPLPLVQRIEDYLRVHGVTSAPVLVRELGISQPTFSRAVARAGSSILRVGRARATRYAARRDIGRAGSGWPLYRLGADGRARRLGVLSAIGGGFHFVPDSEAPAFLHGEFSEGLFPGLPWFLDPLRPQGFLGRGFARRVARTLRVPEDPARWSDDDILLALLEHGHDGCGDLIVGEFAMQNAMGSLLASGEGAAVEDAPACYPALAAKVLAGEATGSSAAGEQPKFAVTLATRDGIRPVIVKFSDRTETPGGRRWADLLLAEHIAGRVLGAHGLAAAESVVHHVDGRVFLESTRFDRNAAGGRVGLVALSAIDAAFHGHGSIRWQDYAADLVADGWLDAGDARRLRRLGWFGDLIGNDDMHLGNAGLCLADRLPLGLAPAYDMLPMRFRPSPGGEVVPRAFEVRPPLPEQREDWLSIAPAALRFWSEVRDHPGVSPDFAGIADGAAKALGAAIPRI